jgi:isoleucyl-tRNA synthetase
MSKSVGNVIEPQEIIDRYGAEILRLWVAAEDYTDDIRISEEILTRLVEAYRRIRNTSRFILGNLYDFNPDRDAVPYHEMEELDRWTMHRLQEIIHRVREAYEKYQFHVVYYTLYNFCTVDLSALYLDVVKDRLYTSRNDAHARRSAQTVMWITLDAMTRLLAPILTFTSEEVWAAMPAASGRPVSVHLVQFPDVNDDFLNEALAQRWKVLLGVRSEISKAIEMARENKTVGHSLDALVELSAPEKLEMLLRTHQEDLRNLSIISQIAVVPRSNVKDPYESKEIDGLAIAVSKAEGEKCGRCWVYDKTVGGAPDAPELCKRCIANIC